MNVVYSSNIEPVPFLLSTDRNGQVRQYQYDAGHNVSSETWYANATDADAGQNAANTIVYTRDSAGRILSESDNGSTDTYAYNDAGQITSTTESSVGVADRHAQLSIRQWQPHADGSGCRWCIGLRG